MKVIKKVWGDVLLLEPRSHEDHRGFFLENYHYERYKDVGIEEVFIQDNHSYSKDPGVLRGMHYQRIEKAQSKLVRVITGAVYDVVIDIRKGSPTYGKWAGFILSEFNKRLLYVPKGFAHGFCTLTPSTHVVYKVDTYYSLEHDQGVLWCDPDIGITWPVSHPILSEKDRNQPLLAEIDTSFTYNEVSV